MAPQATDTQARIFAMCLRILFDSFLHNIYLLYQFFLFYFQNMPFFTSLIHVIALTPVQVSITFRLFLDHCIASASNWFSCIYFFLSLVFTFTLSTDFSSQWLQNGITEVEISLYVWNPMVTSPYS